MNKLNQKLELIYDAADTHREGIEAISKFFLEEIKEAFEAGKQFGSDIQWLKSKYNIDHQER